MSVFILHLSKRVEQQMVLAEISVKLSPSFLFLREAIQKFVPMSLEEKYPQKMRVFYQLLS